MTVHDLAYAHSPELCRPETLEYDGLVRNAIRRGATVHTVSDHVRAEVIEHYRLPAERVVRVHFGVEAVGPGGDAARGRAIARSARYVLALGTVEPRKNHPALVRAFDAVAGDDPELVLVIAGGLGWGADALDRAVATSAHTGRVRVLGYVNDTARADLLAGAAGLAYPSLYEGFGHPPFEAMSAGVPVLAARAGSIPEAVGDAALLVDPRDDDALAAGLARITTDEALRAGLRARGAEQVRRYPWSRAVEEFVALYRRLAA